jgi:hypothetical protein
MISGFHHRIGSKSSLGVELGNTAYVLTISGASVFVGRVEMPTKSRSLTITR